MTGLGLGVFIGNPSEDWRLTSLAAHWSDDSRAWRLTNGLDGGSDRGLGPRPRRAAHVMVGRLKRKGMRNISLTRKQDPDLYPVCIKR